MLRVGHRHSVFTMLDNLKNYFYGRREILNQKKLNNVTPKVGRARRVGRKGC